jgi:hypothetical protein
MGFIRILIPNSSKNVKIGYKLRPISLSGGPFLFDLRPFSPEKKGGGLQKGLRAPNGLKLRFVCVFRKSWVKFQT